MAAAIATRRRRLSSRRRIPALVLSVLVSAALAACGSDTTGPAPVPADQLFWAIHLNARAITLALTQPYDTVQLTATPVTPTGTPLPDAGVVSYQALDSTVAVNPTGLVTAHYVTGLTHVVASLTVHGVTHVDTTFFAVTPTRAFALDSLSIQPQSGGLDSAKVAFSCSFGACIRSIPVFVTDSAGTQQCSGSCSFPVDFTSSNSEVATLDHTGSIQTNDIGHTTFRAAALVYGVYRQDSLAFTVGYQTFLNTYISLGASGIPLIAPTGILGTGGRMIYNNNLSQPVEIVWPYQTQMIRHLGGAAHQLTDTIGAAGNTVTGNFVRFRFDSAGTYTAHLTVLGPGGGGTADATVVVSGGP